MFSNTGFDVRLQCPVCTRTEGTTLLSVPFTDSRVWDFLDFYYGGRVPRETLEGVEYKVVRCNACGLVYQEKILSPEKMELLYDHWVSTAESFSKKASADFHLFRGYAAEIEGIWKFFGGKPSQINVLEFGCGWGVWANMASAYGFNVTAVDLSRSRIEYASKNGLRVVSDLEGEKSESFDYVYSNQVFEHISNPREILERLAQLLSPSGVIHIQVPNGRGIEKKLGDPSWMAKKDALHPLEHINCFTRASLKVLADSAGLKLVAPHLGVDCHSFGSLVLSGARYFRDLTSSTRVYLVKNQAHT